MTNVLKKAFTWSVVAVTIFWSVGFAAFAPMIAQAAECPELEAGDLWKTASKTAVYMQNEDGEALAFPNEKTFLSWGLDFGDVVTLSNSCAEDLELAGFVPYAPGTLVYRDGFGTVYVVGLNGAITPFEDYAALDAVFGANAVAKSRMVSDSHWLAAYDNTGDELDGEMLPDGIFVKTSGSSDVYFVLDGMLYDVEGTVPAPWMVVTVSSDLLDSVEMADESMTASEVAAMALDEVLMGSMDEDEDGDEDSEEADGKLTVSLAGSTPDSNEVPGNAIGVIFTSVNLKNTGDSAVEVTGVTIERTGLGKWDEFDNVYVEVEGVRKGSKRSLGSDNEVEIFFSTASNMITVPAGQTVVLDLVADMDGSNTTTYGSHRLQLTAIQAEGADVSGAMPITGNLMSRSDVEVSSVEFSYDSVNDEVEVGETGETIAEFTLDPSDDTDLELRRIILENSGDADSEDLANITLYRGSTKVAGPVEMEDDVINFELTKPFLFEDGDDYSFEVRADIVSGADSDITLELDEETDVHMYEVLNGYRAGVTMTGTAETVDIVGGDLDIKEASTNPKAESHAAGADDVLLLVAELNVASEPITVTEFALDFVGGLELENVVVKLGNRTIAGPEDFSDSPTGTLEFDEEFEVTGKQLLSVYADIPDNATPGATTTVTLDGSDFVAELTSDDKVAITVTGDADGNRQTVGSKTLSVTKDATYGNESTVAGASDVLVGRYVLRAPTSEAIELEEVTVHFGYHSTSTDVDADSFSNLRVSIDTAEEDDIATADLADGDTLTGAAYANEFDVDTTIARNGSLVLSVYADVESGMSFGATDYVRTALVVAYRGAVSDTLTTSGAVVGQDIQLEEGSLDVEVKTDPESDIVIANGTTEVFVGEFEFEADNETYSITDLDIFVSSTEATDAAALVKSVRITNNKNSDTTTVTSVNSSNEFEFNALSIPVTDGTANTRVKLYAVFNDVESAAVDSGNDVFFDLTGIEADPSSAGSDTWTYDDSGDYETQSFTLRATRPTLTASAGYSAAAVDRLRSGDVEMMTLKVEADAAGDVVLEALLLSITGTTSAVSEIQLWDDKDQIIVTSTVSSGANDFNVSSADEKISAGTSKTYTVVLVTSGIVAGDELIMKLTGFEWQDDDEDDSIADGTNVDGVPSKTFTADRDA